MRSYLGVSLRAGLGGVCFLEIVLSGRLREGRAGSVERERVYLGRERMFVCTVLENENQLSEKSDSSDEIGHFSCLCMTKTIIIFIQLNSRETMSCRLLSIDKLFTLGSQNCVTIYIQDSD